MKGRFTSAYLATSMQEGINAGLNVFGAQLFAESLEKKPAELQAAGFTLLVRDHEGNAWYVTATTTPPEIIE